MVDEEAEGQRRKEKSEAILAAAGVPVNAWLPPIAPAATTVPRTVKEIADRALALCFVTAKGEGMNAEGLAMIDARYRIMDKLTAREQEFADSDDPDEESMINATWRYEALYTLLWAIGYVDDLGFPDQTCNPEQIVRLIGPLTETDFRRKARRRSMDEILDAADLIYRYEWACVDAQIRRQPYPAGIDPGVVYERHYTLNWLTGYGGADWDSITTDS